MFSLDPSSQAQQIALGTHFFNQRYLYAFAPQAEVLHHLRTQALPEERAREAEVLGNWTDLQPRVAALIQNEAGLADSSTLGPVPPELESTLQAYSTDPLFSRSFSQLRTSYAVVEIDKVVAAQRTVNLDYVRKLAASCPDNPTMADLLPICVSPTRQMDAIQHLEVAPNVHVFSSPNSDIRFLGAFVKPLAQQDLASAVLGGLPAAAVIAFVGYGAAPINVFMVGSKLVLNNGFHRVYALRSVGVSHIPVVVQHINNPALEFPPAVAGLPKEYLLNVPRPVLMKDFFEPDFVMDLRVRDRIKMVTIGINLGQHEVPS